MITRRYPFFSGLCIQRTWISHAYFIRIFKSLISWKKLRTFQITFFLRFKMYEIKKYVYVVKLSVSCAENYADISAAFFLHNTFVTNNVKFVAINWRVCIKFSMHNTLTITKYIYFVKYQ